MNPQYKQYEQMKINEVNQVNPYNINGFDLEKILKEKMVDENYYFLLLSIYFYLKHNNYHSTAETLFNEINLGKIFQFPQEIGDPKNDSEKLKKKFINYFYYNTFFQQSDTSDFLSDFWNQFWEIFVTKIKHSNQTNSVMDQYLSNSKIQLTCKNFFNL